MRILFVCTGNTCRSPMAERLFKHYTASYQGIEAVSAGTNAWMSSGMSSQSEELLRREGVDTSGFKSQPVTQVLVDDCDLILTMGKSHLDYVTRFFPRTFSKTFLLKSYVDENILNAEILDPYAGENITYEECFKEIKEAVLKLKEKLIDESQKSKVKTDVSLRDI